MPATAEMVTSVASSLKDIEALIGSGMMGARIVRALARPRAHNNSWVKVLNGGGSTYVAEGNCVTERWGG
jgi:hypothetical protein